MQSGAPSARVDIVIPVFGAAAELERCLASVMRHTAAPEARILVVLDGPQPAEVESVVGGLMAGPWAPQVSLLRPPARRGFAACVNDGIATSDNDVVLLNSDTEVSEGWLRKLGDAARSAPEVGSVTPFSNSATICSLPRWLEENAIPAGLTLDGFARIVEDCSLRQRPTIPTGVGFCMLLRRSALKAVGAFDVGFGLGYGEEVDWCFRAARAGWRHVLDDATFVFHAGQASFGAARDRRVRSAERRLRLRYRDAWRNLADFIRRDPLEPARRRVLERLQPARSAGASQPRVLHVVHGWPPWNHAGTELYAARLARWQGERRETAALARIAHPGRRLGDAVELLDRGVRVRLLVNNFSQRNPASRGSIREPLFERAFARLLEQERPDLVHIHHLAGFDAGLPGLAKRRGLPVVYQVQDWWTLCARANLLDRERKLCTGPGAAKCSRCLPLTSRLPRIMNPALHVWRRRALRNAFRSADAWIMGSEFIAASFREFGLLSPKDAAHVLPYGIDPPARVVRARQRSRPLRVGFIGSLLPHKGAHVAIAAFRGMDPAVAILDVWGDPTASAAYTNELRSLAGDAVRFRGRFAEGEEAALFADLDVVVVPSLGLESYGFVPREALAHGVHTLVSRRGALAELAAQAAGCEAFDPDDPEELRGLLQELVDRQPSLARQPPLLAPDWATHAMAVEQVYETVWSGTRASR